MSVQIYSSGTLISTDDVITSAVLAEGGNNSMYVSNGGTANSTTVNSGGRMYVSSGGTADNTTVNSWSVMHVSSGGTANSTTVNSGGYLDVGWGGTADNTTVNSSGGMYVSSGGTASNITASSGAYLVFVVAPDTYIQGTSNGSAFEIKDGKVDNYTIDRGYLYVSSGGTADNTTVNSSGQMYVSRGGTASNTTIKQGGAINGFSFESDLFIGIINNENRLNISNVIVSNYAHLYSGDTATNTTVNSYGYLRVSNGGTANSTTVNTWGSMYVDGTANNTTVNRWGKLYVSSGGTANSTTVNSSWMYVSSGGTANSTTVNSNGYLDVPSGGTANSTTVNSGGDLWVYSGGVANSTTVNSSGRMHVSSGGTATNIIADSGAELRLTVAPDTYIQGTSNGSAFEIKDGKVDNYTIDRGYLYVSSGGTADNTTVNSSGQMYVSRGGTATNTTVNSDGWMYVSRGGTALQIKENGGYVEIVNGANVTFLENTFSNLVLNTSATVHSGTTAINTTVDNWGRMYVSSGGITNNTTVNSGGRMSVSSGGVTNGAIIYSGGYMYVSSGGIVGGTLRTETGAVVSAYEGSIIDFTVADQTAEDDYLINDLSLIQGSPTYTITVHSSQTIGTYKLAQGAENFTGTLSIGTETTNYGTITVNGDILVRNDLSYKLVQDNGDLTLGIYRFADISRVTANTVYPTQKLYLFATFNEHSAQKLYSYDQKTWFEYDKNVLVEDNVTVYFKALNGNGVESEIKSYTVTNIDKTPPTLTISGNPTEWTNQGITLDVIANDENGISRIEYSEDSGATWKTWSSRYMESGNFLFRAVDTVGNISEVSEVVVDKIDTIQPTLKGLKGLPSTWTNQDTFVTIIAEDNLSGIAKVEYRFWNEQEFTEGSSFVLDKNHYGTVTVRVTDKAGNVTERIYYDAGLGFVDQIAPQITINHNPDLETWRNGAVSLTIFVTDDGGSSIKEEKYRFDYEPEDTWHRIGSQVTVTQNCTVYFKVTDNAGNVTTDEFTVDCLDNNAPTYTVTQSTNKPTYDPVTITISADDDLSGVKLIEYSFNNISWLEGNSFTMDRNGFYWVRVSDNAGNVSALRQFFVTNIDTNPPEKPVVSADKMVITNKPVLVTAEFSSDSVVKEYSFDQKTWFTYADGVTMLENGSVYFRSQDEAGNWSDITEYKVDNIFIRNDIINLGASGTYELKFSNDNFKSYFDARINGVAMEVYAPNSNWQYKNGNTINTVNVMKEVKSVDYFEANENSVVDIFLARSNGVWSKSYSAEYQGSANLTQKLSLAGKNKICDIFVGSSDSNILFLTNDSNGDALFIDDIYSASFDNLGESNSRLAQIKEIQAGDGDDIIDLTSNKFNYSGSEMTIYGGSGNDIIWANDSVDNVIHGGLGDDTLVGGSQANTFVFEANWGNDVIYCNGTVTLNFIGVEEGDLTINDNVISYNGNSVTLHDFDKKDYTITYSQLA